MASLSLCEEKLTPIHTCKNRGKPWHHMSG